MRCKQVWEGVIVYLRLATRRYVAELGKVISNIDSGIVAVLQRLFELIEAVLKQYRQNKRDNDNDEYRKPPHHRSSSIASRASMT